MDGPVCADGWAHENADIDALTGLPGRSALHRDLDAWIARGAMAEFALLRFDIVGFHRFNEYYGEACGDRILRCMAVWLGTRLSGNARLVRSGSNEFSALVAVDTGFDAVAVTEFAHVLGRDSAKQAIELDGVLIYCSLAIGIARWPTDARTAAALLQRSGLALRLAKEEVGRDAPRSVDHGEVSRRRFGRLQHEALWRAVHHGDNRRLAFQPQVDPRTGRVAGVEVLLRVTHPGGQSLSTERVVALAERTGLIREIDRGVLTDAMKAMRNFVLGDSDRRVAVNLSSCTLEANLPIFVRDALCMTGFPPDRLELELTETGIVSSADTPMRASVLAELAALGPRIIIDDFGAGYAGFSRLRSVPAAGFKLDRSIIAGYGECRFDTELVDLFAEMGAHLGCSAIVEGVESRAHMDVARRLGYERVQGWYIAPALSLVDFEEFAARIPEHTAAQI